MIENYKVEVYEQLRGNGIARYKVCAVVNKSILWGLIKYKRRYWLTAWGGVETDSECSEFREDKQLAIETLHEAVRNRNSSEKASKIIHFKKIDP